MGLTNNLGKLSNMITSTGSAVGIGTSSPSSTLQVSRGGAIFQLTDTNKTNNNTFSIYGFTQTSWAIATGNSGTFSGGEKIIITDSGNVGIGTSSPVSKLSIGGDGYADRAITAIASGTDFAMTVQQNSTGAGIQILRNGGNWGNAPFQIQSTSGGTQFIVNSSGNVGIGTSSPAEILHLNSSSTNAAFIRFQNTGGSGVYVGGRNDNMELYAGGSQRMTIQSYGRIDSTISTNITNTHYIVHSGTNPYGINITFTGASPNNETNNYLYFADSSNSRFVVYSSGATYNRTGTYGTLSDISLKENIIDSTPKLDDILKLKVRNFNIRGVQEKQIGFIAQEFEEVFPNLVDVTKDKETNEELKAIKTSVLVPMLVKAIQELSAKVTALENK